MTCKTRAVLMIKGYLENGKKDGFIFGYSKSSTRCLITIPNPLMNFLLELDIVSDKFYVPLLCENSIFLAEWFDISLCNDTIDSLWNVRLHL